MKPWSIIGPTVPFKGGVALHTTELARRLVSEGYAVTLLSWKHQYPKRLYPGVLEPDEPEDIAFRETHRVLSWNRPDSWLRVGFQLRKTQSVNVFVGATPFQYPFYLIILLTAGKVARRNSVLIAHNVVPHETSRLDEALSKLLFRSVSRVLTHSKDEKRRAEHFGAKTLYSKLPLHFPGELRRRGPRKTTRELLFLGFVRPYKGLDLLLEAISTINPPVRLTVAGEFWEPQAKYDLIAEELGVADQVSFLNRYITTGEMVNLLHTHDALVLPYRSATGSQLPHIATACGVPCILTPTGLASENVGPGTARIVAEDISATAIARAIESLYQDPLPNVDYEIDEQTQQWNDYLQALRSASSPRRWEA